MPSLHSEKHKINILKKLGDLRTSGFLCDIEIEVEERLFKAHSVLLAASSDYFHLLFTSNPNTNFSTIKIDNVTADVFALVIDFIYSGQICVEEHHLEQLSEAAAGLKIKDLIDEIAEAVSKNEKGQKTGKLSTRKRGRPRKIVKETVESERTEEARRDEGNSNETDANEEQSKRQIKVPLKYKCFTVGQGESKKREKGRRGRKRKYPNTEARCDQCEKVFKSHLFLKIHQRIHTGEKPFFCSVCGKGFTQKHSLIVHQRSHTGERPFLCSICNKALCTKSSLQEHMKLHEGNRSFSCDKCDRTFTQRRQLRSHYRVHTDKSLPECAKCHHKFLDTAQLKKHLRTHTGEKPFTCEICGKCFTCKSTLQTHIRIHRGEKPYECSMCQKSFSDPSARRRHAASHSGKKPFSCLPCNVSFTRRDSFKNHLKTHNKEPASTSQDSQTTSQTNENLLELQAFPTAAEEIQLTVSPENLNFVEGQDQSVTLFTQNFPEMAVVSAEGESSEQSEQMQFFTLSKEEMDQLQGFPSMPGVAQGAEEQSIHISSRTAQTISFSQSGQQRPHPYIHRSVFRIQAGTCTYLF